MDMKEAKELFEKHHPEEVEVIEAGEDNKHFQFAACVWRGFKSALIATKQLKCDCKFNPPEDDQHGK